MTESPSLDLVFAALAHPARRAMLAQLARGDLTVNALAAPFDMSLPAISRHLKVLEDAGLVERERRGQFRPCRIRTAPLQEVVRWTEQYRPIWDARFDVMEGLLTAEKDNRDE